ncbi:hypothetical protein D1007_56726 [Hordeum vulgare]|nr:hypothetical protein D1007_56726 [Hordeum vulgare]
MAKMGVSRSSPACNHVVQDLGKEHTSGALPEAIDMLSAVSLSAYLHTAKRKDGNPGQLGVQHVETEMDVVEQPQEVHTGVMQQSAGEDLSGLNVGSVGLELGDNLWVDESPVVHGPDGLMVQNVAAADGVRSQEVSRLLVGGQAQEQLPHRSSSPVELGLEDPVRLSVDQGRLSFSAELLGG